jgi:poly-gamma-glutamate capsule biosynthesis protein CapA/YwtB (metallophosphatase superfamily)
MRALGTTAAALVVMLTAACAGNAGAVDLAPSTSGSAGTRTTVSTTPPAGDGTGTPTTAAGVSPTTASTRTTTQAHPASLTLAFAGDVHFEQYLAPLARDPHGLEELQGTLGAADLSVVNLETALTERGTPIGKEFHFRAPASALDTLAGAGVDAVSMANNHGADFGAVGLRDTLAAKRTSPIPIAGIGANAQEAFTPATLEAKGLRVALFGASQVYEMTLASWSADADSPGIASATPLGQLRRAVEKASRTHDLVVVFMHWGLDYQQCQDGLSTSTATALEAAGADIIVGGHSHRVNGAGWLGRAYVAYGLGNFVWWRSREPDSRTGVLTLTVDARAARRDRSRPVVTDARWTPMLVGADGIPREPGAADRARLMRVWEQASACSGLSRRGE